MSLILDAIAKHALKQAGKVAIQGQTYAITYAQLAEHILSSQHYFLAQKATRMAILMDNTPAVLIVDLGCIKAEIPLIPVPLFFSPQQVQHALQSSDVDFLVSNLGSNTEALLKLISMNYDLLPTWEMAGKALQVYRLHGLSEEAQAVPFPKHVQKITYTSGSTGNAKGVCLSQSVMDNVAISLAQATEACAEDRHLCLLPYATLLENIAG
ncbi:MAG: AMP-binding protein, partial [Mariprofundaceae bacterium]|nr:AMP-binding protein [Mariprofundaceae bacterium]